jgi:hypothetical protein
MDMRAKHVAAENGNNEVIDDLNKLIEQLWRDLDGKVSQTRIRQVATGVAAKFHDAPVTANIPLFIRHLTREWLKGELRGRDLKG